MCFRKSRGGENKLQEFVAENLLQFEEVPNDYQQYFEYILTNTNLERGYNWIAALNLYRELLYIFNENN
jgi:hypothetical protein